MTLITCYAKLNFHFSDLRSLLPHRDTNDYTVHSNILQRATLSARRRFVSSFVSVVVDGGNKLSVFAPEWIPINSLLFKKGKSERYQALSLT